MLPVQPRGRMTSSMEVKVRLARVEQGSAEEDEQSLYSVFPVQQFKTVPSTEEAIITRCKVQEI